MNDNNFSWNENNAHYIPEIMGGGETITSFSIPQPSLCSQFFLNHDFIIYINDDVSSITPFKAHKTKLAMMCVTKSDNEHLFVIFTKSDLLKFIF